MNSTLIALARQSLWCIVPIVLNALSVYLGVCNSVCIIQIFSLTNSFAYAGGCAPKSILMQMFLVVYEVDFAFYEGF